MTNPFSPDVVAAVGRHMNDDHSADSVVICRALGGVPDALVARMTGLDGDGIDFEVTEPVLVAVRVPWSRALTERAEIRVEVTRMYHEARELLGL
ncbi:hypothetical protein Lfu02_24160 [Longispora fulva]|uniref:Putative heme iron utilization protein n=1 Tax=Longispora fulva TaxID=619741 RepID=A0A8J7GX49_9ACTN|nr:DUF2470 domain-containing protein [Longispora fulva]MBG6139573.1 putative heme iron utilization protein [Longispora fulva]GIG58044.1 hypothetical protein Lfu02_24160 [Longispora fulva]